MSVEQVTLVNGALKVVSVELVTGVMYKVDLVTVVKNVRVELLRDVCGASDGCEV